jgi:hypothetical protein
MKWLYPAVGACGLVFIATPYMPDLLLKVIVGNVVGVFVLLALSVVAVRKNPMLGMAVFLAAASLFLEQRRRTVSLIQQTYGAEKAIDNLIVPARDIIPNEVHPPHLDPEIETHDFEPSKEDNEFSPVGDSINEKHALTSGSMTTEKLVEMFESKGLASIS